MAMVKIRVVHIQNGPRINSENTCAVNLYRFYERNWERRNWDGEDPRAGKN